MNDKKKEAPKLKYIESIHEQREYNRRIIPKKGVWVEEGKFKPIIESFDIKKRWECLSVTSGGENKDQTLCVELKPLDHEKYEDTSRKLAKKIIEKHGETLVESLRNLMIIGLYTRNESIKEVKKRNIRRAVKSAGNPEKKETYKRLEDAEIRYKKTKEDAEKCKKEIEKLKSKLEGEKDEKRSQKTTTGRIEG